MIKTVLIGGLAVTILTFFLNGNGNRGLRGNSSSTGSSRVRYGPPYLPPGVPIGSNDSSTSPQPHFRIILSSNQNRNNTYQRVSPQSILNGSLSSNETGSNFTGSIFLTPPSLALNNVSSDESTIPMVVKTTEAVNGSSNSSLSQPQPILMSEEDIAGQGIAPPETTFPDAPTTVSYISLRGPSNTIDSSSEVTTHLFESNSISTKKSTPVPQSTTSYENGSSTTIVSEELVRTFGAQEDLRSESTTKKLPSLIPTQAATERSISYLPVSTSQRNATETVTESHDYVYYYVETSGEEKSPVGQVGPNTSSSSSYLPPAQPATSLRLPISNGDHQYGGYNLPVNVNQSSSSGIRNYSTNTPERIPATYLPPRRVV